MIGKIPVNDDKIPTPAQIMQRLLRKKFPGTTFAVQRHIIQACAEEFHNMLMEHWRDRMVTVDQQPKPSHSLDSMLSQYRECSNCGNLTMNRETGLCAECSWAAPSF